MDDSEFDKLYAGKIRQAGAPDLSDEDWERLTPVLDARERRRWRVLPLWWLGALSGILLCSNLGWWWMWKQSEKRSEALQNEWRQIRPQASTQQDTIWSKVVVYQYDTVYRTTVYRAVSEGVPQNYRVASASKNGLPMDQERSAVSDPSPQVEGPTDLAQISTDLPPTPGDGTAQNLDNIQAINNLDVLPAQTYFLKIPARQIKTPGNNLVFIPLKKSHTPRQPLLIPRKFRLGAGGGFILPSGSNLSNNTGFANVLNAELSFTDKLALTLEGAYMGISFNGKVYDERLGLPPQNSPGDDYVFKHFETDEGYKTILQLSAGMRYWFRANHKLSPYLGFAYAAQWHPEFELKLEYYNPLSDQDKEVSMEVPSMSRPVSFLEMNAGLRYRFKRQLYWQSGASYQFKIDPSQPGIPRFWGIKTAVLYEF